MLSPFRCAAALLVCATSAGCALPAVVPVAGAALGAADVTLFRGCIGVQMSNTLPWNFSDPYGCVPARFILPGAPTDLGQITGAFTRQ